MFRGIHQFGFTQSIGQQHHQLKNNESNIQAIDDTVATIGSQFIKNNYDMFYNLFTNQQGGNHTL